MKNVRKIYECSTTHLPQFTADQIDCNQFPKKPTMSNEYGWLFSVPETLLELEQGGVICSAFLKIMALAQDSGCDFVLFDRDVEPVEYLQIHEW